jgi:hypothetical protein
MRRMGGFWNWDLIQLFNFYLALIFLLSTALRVRQYEAVLRLVRAFRERWPRLFELMRQHHSILLTWGNAIPALTALALCVVNTLACRLVWPHAHLSIARLLEIWPALAAVSLCAAAMVAVDGYATVQVGEVNRNEMEKYFDQAEFWLTSWTAPVVRVFTLGWINPRKMVHAEVRKSLEDASKLLNSTMWWVSVQTLLRIAYGLSLWLTFAIAGPAPKS